MASARLCFWLASFLAAASLQASSQVLAPGLEKRLQFSGVQLENIGNAALVAYTWNTFCGEQLAGSGYTDVATTYAGPYKKGPVGEFRIDYGCQLTVTACVFADGYEAGDSEELIKIHRRRLWVHQEIDRTLREDILPIKMDDWIPQETISDLRKRLAALPAGTWENQDEVYTRQEAIKCLIDSITHYAAKVVDNEQQATKLRYVYLKFLQEWDTAVVSDAYPAKRTWWKTAEVHFR